MSAIRVPLRGIAKLFARIACWLTKCDAVKTGDVAEGEPDSNEYGRVFGTVYYCRRCDKATICIRGGNKLAGCDWEVEP